MDRTTIYEHGLPFGGYAINVGEGDRDGALLVVTDKDGNSVNVVMSAGDLFTLAYYCDKARAEVKAAQKQAA